MINNIPNIQLNNTRLQKPRNNNQPSFGHTYLYMPPVKNFIPGLKLDVNESVISELVEIPVLEKLIERVSKGHYKFNPKASTPKGEEPRRLVFSDKLSRSTITILPTDPARVSQIRFTNGNKKLEILRTNMFSRTFELFDELYNTLKARSN